MRLTKKISSTFVSWLTGLFRNMENINTFLQVIIGLAAITGTVFFIWKLVFPNVGLSILSNYPTFDKENKIAILLKIRSEASFDITIKDIKVSALTNKNEEIEFVNNMIR